jgi:acyl-CoA reductase-like NAD-dependent aldehyde dehydrogenase
MSAPLRVWKTWKLYVNGQFPRSESGRYDVVKNASGATVANVCRASRKDLRDAVEAARAAFPGWAGRSAMNRGQILYRIAEMMDGRRAELAALLGKGGEREVDAAVERWIHYAGWTDKYQALLGTVNPVAGPWFNFSMAEPSGVAVAFAPEEAPLLALTSLAAPLIAGANTCIAILSESAPLPGLLLGEILATSDVPAGVLNLLSGRRAELLPHAAGHRDVNTLLVASPTAAEAKLAQEEGAGNVKRVHCLAAPSGGWSAPEAQGLAWIERGQELKTVWHTMQL